MGEAVDKICGWLDVPLRPYRYVVTPNVDHIILLQKSQSFRDAYEKASLSVIDGWPVAKAVSFLSARKVDVVPGSDLVPAIFDKLQKEGKEVSIFLLGAAEGVGMVAAQNIKRSWPALKKVHFYSPPYGFESDTNAIAKVRDVLIGVNPDLLIVGLGAPKQEMWARSQVGADLSCVAICAGATIDFLAENKRRAPLWVRKSRIEWLYRVAQEPRRLFSRYAKGVLIFPCLFFREVISRKKRI